MAATSKWLTKVGGETLWLTREEQAALCLPKPRGRAGAPAIREKKPLKSLSASCHRKQVGLMRDAMRAHGISGAQWDNNGKCQFTSRRARARAMKVIGPMLNLGPLHDNDGGYGDG